MDFGAFSVTNEYLQAVIIFAISLVLILVSRSILLIAINRMLKNKQNVVRFIHGRLAPPIYAILLLSGTNIAVRNLSLMQSYVFELDGLTFVLLALLCALLISRLLNVAMGNYLKSSKGVDHTPQLLNRLLSGIIYAIAFLMILNYFQIDITPMITALGLATLAIGLALQSTLANLFAGVHLLSDRPISVGNYIELDESTGGTIVDIGWRSTRIRTLADNLLIIPNAKLADSNITNYSEPKKDLSIFIPCGVAYESDLDMVQKVTLEVAKHIQQTTDGAVKDFEPIVRYREFEQSNITMLIILRVSESLKRFFVRTEFIKALKKRYDAEGIEISWPIRKIYNMPVKAGKKDE